MSASRFFSKVVVSVDSRWFSVGQARLRVIVESGSGVRHLAEVTLHEVPLLGIELEAVELLVQRLAPASTASRRAGSSPGGPT